MRVEGLLKKGQSPQEFLNEGGVLFLLNEVEDVKVKLTKQGTFLKPLGKEEYTVNFEKSKIAQEALAYGEVLTMEEYEKL